MSTQQLQQTQSTTARTQPMIIHGVSARSSLGRGIAAILEALESAGTNATSEPVPIDDFVMKEEVGPKGIRNLDRATGLALSAVDKLMEEAPTGFQTENTALILGTSMGSVSSTIRFTQDGLSGTRPYLVNPAKFPNTVMNFAAGQTAIRHRLTGPNATIIAGNVTGLSALRYASRMLCGGQAANVIIGATEELTTERQMIHDAGPDVGSGLGEGCAVLLLGPAPSAGIPSGDTLAHGVVTGFRDQRVPEDSQLDYLTAGALALSGDGTSPAVLVISGHDPAVDAVLQALMRQTGSIPAVVDIKNVLGHTGAASMAFALAVCSETLRQGKYGTAATGWVLGVDFTGYMGVAVLEGSGVRNNSADHHS